MKALLDYFSKIKLTPLRIALSYCVMNLLFITLGDYLLAIFIQDMVIRSILEEIKDWVYLSLSAVLLYYMVKGITQSIRLSQRALARESELLRRLMNNVVDGIYFKDRNGCFIRANHVVLEGFGLSTEEQLLGKTDFDFFEESLAKKFQEEEQGIFKTGQPIINQVEKRQTLTGSEEHLVATSKSPVYDNDGTIIGIVGVSRDITRRIETEESLQDKINRLEILKNLYQTIAVSLDFKTAYLQVREIFPKYLSSLGVDNVSLLLYDKKLGGLVNSPRIYMADYMEGVSPGSQDDSPEDLEIQDLGYSISGKCFEEKRSILIQDCTKSDIIPKEYVDKYHLRSSVAVPIIIKQNPIGVLRIDNMKETNRFSESDLEFFTMIAEQLGIVFENARLFTEQALAERALRQSEARFRRIAESNMLGITFWNMDGTIIEANEAFLKISGYSREDLIAHKVNWKNMTPPKYLSLDEKALEEIHFNGVCTPFEKEYIRKDGSIIPIYLGAALMDDSSNTAVGFVLDLSDQKKAEQQSKIYSELGQKLATVETSKEAAKEIVEAADKIIGWDACTMDLFSLNENIVYESYNVDTINSKKEEVFPVLKGGAPSKIFLTTIKKGARLILRSPSDPLTDFVPFGDTNRPSASLMFVPILKGKKAVGVISIQSYTPNAYTQEDLKTFQALADLCSGALERKRTESALRESEERYRAFLQNSSEGIWRLEFRNSIDINFTYEEQIELFYQNGYLGECNDAMAQMYGYTRGEEMIGLSLEKLFDSKDPVSRNYFRTFIVSGYQLADMESKQKEESGHSKYFLNNLVGILENGLLIRVWGSQRDNTERKRAEVVSRAFAELGNKLNVAATPKEAAFIIVNTADELLKWDSCTVHFYSSTNHLLENILSMDIVDGKRTEVPPAYSSEKPTHTIVLKAIHECAQLILRENPDSETELSPFGDKSRRSASLMFVPCRKGESVVGVLSIQSYTLHAYTHKDLEILQALGDHCSSALERIQALMELQKTQEIYRQAIVQAKGVPYHKDYFTNTFSYIGEEIYELTGYSSEEITTEIWNSIIQETVMRGESDGLTVDEAIIKTHAGLIKEWQADYRIRTRSGDYRWVSDSSVQVLDAEGNPMGAVGILQDITERKRTEEQLFYDAFHDTLTKLPNRALFIDRLGLAISHIKRRKGYAFAVLFLDLDRFKVINDSLGHMVGDQLLISLSERLQTYIRPGDTVARLGGDEFTILLDDVKDITDAINIAERIQTELKTPFIIAGHDVFTTVSIGIAFSLTGYDKPEDVLRDADTAMYRAKILGKARHEVFDKNMHLEAMQLLQLETDLRKAVDHHDFNLHYQPIVSLETGQITGIEALLRWNHPTRGLLLPIEFIPIAEETGLIIPISRWVLRQACLQLYKWQKKFPNYANLSVSVNLYVREFNHMGLLESIQQVLRETELPSHCLGLELTESVLMEESDKVHTILSQLRELQVKLYLDDFGTGYSSLSYLHRFPISVLKIDRSFIRRMCEPEGNIEIVNTILSLATNLKLDVIAEGVETIEQLQMLRSIHCQYAQGNYFSPPLDEKSVEKLLSNKRHW